ncbi:MAG: sigma-54 dependent transcriptional regulator [Kofleriaceae bacterium]
MKPKVIIVDDKLALAETLADGLVDQQFDAVAFGSATAALAAVTAGEIDVVVTDLRMPELDGLALLDAIRAAAPQTQVIVMTAFGAVDSAVEAIRKGAYHYLTKPFKIDELAIFVRRAIGERALRRETATLRQRVGAHGDLVVHSAAMQRVLAIVERIATANVPVMITGETGTGKGALAHAIHTASSRATQPFIAINCAALPEQLLESELFGHVKGAFTGATHDHPGLFVAADGGTLLLDELAEMPIALQPKLLRVLEAGSVRPVGATRERTVDVRVIAATHRKLDQAIASGALREDVLYRLNVLPIEVPPLRDRRDDIAPLVEHFLADALARHPDARAKRFARSAMRRLLDHAWPGNVRELAHVVERGVLLASSDEISPDDLGLDAAAASTMQFTGDVVSMNEIQRGYARWALDRFGGHKARTAERLDIDAKTLNRWLAHDYQNGR